jgi:hypothetical protein
MADENITLQEIASLIAGHLGDKFLDATRLLRKVQDETPERFAELAELCGMSIRKAYYLAQIDRKFEELGFPEDRLYEIGWTKLQIIGPYIDKENCVALVRLAEVYTAQKLKMIVQGKYPFKGARSVFLYFTSKQYEIFESAVVSCGAVKVGKGLAGKEEALITMLSGLTE